MGSRITDVGDVATTVTPAHVSRSAVTVSRRPANSDAAMTSRSLGPARGGATDTGAADGREHVHLRLLI